MKPLKILFLTAFPPNRKTAGQNYTLNLLEDLSHSYIIDVWYWDYPGHQAEINPLIHNYKRRFQISPFKDIGRFLPYFPLFTRRFSLKYLKELQGIAPEYDLIYFDFSQTFIYSYFIKHSCKIGMSHDVIIQKYKRNKLGRLILPWIKISEKIAISKINRLFTFSSKDKELLNKLYNKESEIVPFYISDQIWKIDLRSLSLDDSFVMYGAWNRTENQESILWVLEHYKDTYPNLIIIGGGLPNEIISKIRLAPNIKYIGFVDNPYIYIAKSKALIAPLFHGAGVKVKAIESLALGTPIIGNEITFEGLPPILDETLFNVSNPLDLKKGIIKYSEITNHDKIAIQASFKKNYLLKSFKDQIMTQI